MKLLIVLSVIACVYADKLDRTYLPPSNAGTAGGSPGSLNTPLGPSGFGQPAGFGQPRPNAGFNGAVQTSGPAFGGNTGFGAPSNQYGQPGSAGQAVETNFDAGFSRPAQNFGNQAQDYQRNQPQRAQASAEQSAEILRSDSQNDGETFSYSFETSNGISAEESGVATNGVQAQGAFAYSSDDGQTFRVQYTADENGYQPQGDHLPTSPPIPDEILKSIEENARAAASGTQEGAYNPDEDNNDVSPQQYNNNAPTSYNQAPTGKNEFNQAGKPAQVYGASNAGPRPQGPQGFSQGPQTSPQQYNAGSGAPNGGAVRPSGFGQSQAASPSQLYGSPSTGASNGAARPNGFAPQGPSQYSAGPSGASNFAPSAPQTRPQQYQVSPSGQFPSAGRPQGSGQAQDASGYQYNKPQGGFGGNSNNGPAQQYRPQNGAPSAAQGSRPSGNAFPSSGSNGQGSFGSPARPNSAFGPSGASPSSQGSYGSAPTPNSQGSFAPSGPSGSSGPKSPSSFGSNSQASFGSPARPNSAFGASGGQSGPSSNGFGRPQAVGSNGQGFSRPQGQAPGSKGSMSDSGYEYNRPSGSQFGGSSPSGGSQFGGSSPSGGSQFGGSSPSGSSQFGGSSPSGGSQFGGSSPSGGSQFGGSSPSGGSQIGGSSPNTKAQFGGSPQNGQARPGQFGGSPQSGQPRPGQFGAPRAPPSFSEEEGYKY